MKLDGYTLDILKNFATINPCIAAKKGDVLKTVSLSQSVIAKAKLAQQLEGDFAIYDLSNFIAALSMFDGPVLDFSDERFMLMTNEDRSATIQYYYAEASQLVVPPEKDFPPLVTNLKFRLTKETLEAITRAVSVLSLPEIVFIADGSKVSVQAVNHKVPSSNFYNQLIGESESTFQVFIKVENIKFIKADYDVAINAPKSKTGSPIVHFNGPNIDYWVAAEQHSKL